MYTFSDRIGGAARTQLLGTVLGLAAGLAAGPAAMAADHRDGSIAQDQPADIADTYAFVNPNDTTKVVLGVTVNPYTVPGVTASFSTDLLYQIKIDNDGDFVEDLVIQAVYDVLGGAQQVKLLGPARPIVTGAVNYLLPERRRGGGHGPWRRHRRPAVPVFKGPSDATVQEDAARGLRVFSGRTDDPFFIDLVFVRSVLSVPGVPPLNELLALRDPGADLFAGLNVSSLMIELPIKAVAGRSEHINVWSTVSRQKVTLRSSRRSERSIGPWVQIDREGLPAINAALVPPALRDEFNRASPRRDVRRFARAVSDFLAAKPNLLGDVYFDFVSTTLFPDVLRLDLTNADSGLELVDDPANPGQPILSFNGRAPRDDFIDLFLFALSGGTLSSDGLDANDCTPVKPRDPKEDCTKSQDLDNGFPTKFPFLGAEHAPEELIPPRN